MGDLSIADAGPFLKRFDTINNVKHKRPKTGTSPFLFDRTCNTSYFQQPILDAMLRCWQSSAALKE
jgi:hypothetical protein